MSLFEKVKEAFVEEVPDPAPHQSHLPSAKSVALEVPGAVSMPTNGFHKADADPEALATLETKLKQSQPQLYTHFMEQFESLRDVIPDEVTRFKAALKTSHATVDQILSALDQLSRVMDRAHSEFMDAFNTNLEKVKTTAQQSISTTEELIKSKEAQLKAVQDEIASHRSKRDAEVQSLNAEQAHLESVRQGFEAALAQVSSRLNTQKEKVSAMPKG